MGRQRGSSPFVISRFGSTAGPSQHAGQATCRDTGTLDGIAERAAAPPVPALSSQQAIQRRRRGPKTDVISQTSGSALRFTQYKAHFYVDTRANPPRSIWTHPADEPGAKPANAGFAPPPGPPPPRDQYRNSSPAGGQQPPPYGEHDSRAPQGYGAQAPYGGGGGGGYGQQGERESQEALLRPIRYPVNFD